MTGLLDAKSLHILGDRLLLEPIYGTEKLGSLYVTESYKVEQPHQGEVVAVGAKIPFGIGDRLVVRPFVGEPVGSGNLMVYGLSHIVAQIIDRELYPKPKEVMIVPDWSRKYKQTSSLIYLPPSALEHNEPAQFGTIARCGSEVTLLKTGDYVIYPDVGVEVGHIDTNYYFLNEQDILAHYHDN